MRDADTGALVASGRAPHTPTSPPRSEQHPDEWWSAFDTAIGCTGSHRIDAVAVAGQQHGLVALDASGRVVRPAKLWNDTESASQSRALIDRFGPRAWAEACGSLPVAAFTVTKVSWLAEHEPDALRRTSQLLLPHDWLNYRLTGELVTDRGDASGTGYFSPRESCWRPDLLELIDADVDWPGMLPRVLGVADPAGAWEGAVVGPGTGDNMAAALGLRLRPGDIVISIGTSGTVYARSPHAVADASGAVAGFADATGAFLPLVCTLNATKVTDATARLLGVERDAFDALALAAPPGAGGVVLLPYLDGERTPNRPEATGTLSGLRSDVTREQLARAAVEGVVCGLLDGLDALHAAGIEVASGRLVLIGGGSRSRAYQRVLADVAGRPVLVPPAQEHVAAGACVQAAAVLHGSAPDDVAAVWPAEPDEIIEPESIDRASIRSAYATARDAS